MNSSENPAITARDSPSARSPSAVNGDLQSRVRQRIAGLSALVTGAPPSQARAAAGSAMRSSRIDGSLS